MVMRRHRWGKKDRKEANSLALQEEEGVPGERTWAACGSLTRHWSPMFPAEDNSDGHTSTSAQGGLGRPLTVRYYAFACDFKPLDLW